MSCFQLPTSLCKRIQSILTRFWWDANPEKKKMCWVAWSKLAKPKALGGLGFREIQDFNTGLLAKLSWRLLKNPSCLLAKILGGKYYHNVSFLSCKPSTSASHGWRGILVGRDLIMNNIGKTIGDGRSTSVWEDPWISTTTPLKSIGPPTETAKDLLVADLFLPNGAGLNRDKIEEIIPELYTDILCIRPSIKGASGSFVWLPHKEGLYTTRSAYQTIYRRNTHRVLIGMRMSGQD